LRWDDVSLRQLRLTVMFCRPRKIGALNSARFLLWSSHARLSRVVNSWSNP
jgi:hypothetical protein